MFIADVIALDPESITVSFWTTEKIRLALSPEQIATLEAARARAKARPDPYSDIYFSLIERAQTWLALEAQKDQPQLDQTKLEMPQEKASTSPTPPGESIVAVVSSHGVQLSRRGTCFVGRCPFHASEAQSFHVNDDRGFYYCFECQAGGRASEFVSRMSRK